MMATSSGAVLFDLDGTLIDSFPGIAAAYHHTLTHLGLSDLSDDAIRAFIGPPIQEVLGGTMGLTGDRLTEGIHVFRDHYGTKGLFRFSKYEGIDEMLSILRDAGFELCIATSKLASMARIILDHAGWTELFRVVGGALPDGSRHLKTDVVRWSLDQLNPNVRAIAIVGDRAADIFAGNSQGLTGIGVSWGYGDVRELTEAGAGIIVNHPSELRPALNGLG
jgi:phosphoglycolate phosphatase